MTAFLRRAKSFFAALDARLSRFRLPIGAAVSVLFAGCFSILSVFCGPLYNLNDIGSFDNRVVFIVMASAAYALLLLLTAALCRGGLYRMLLRQLIVTAGMIILFTGINQKTYFYTEQMLPLVRAMDEAGLSAMAGWETNLSVPAMTLLYLITRGPVYDMYTVKLLCVFCFLALCILTTYLADRRDMGMRSEALLALCVILPQGFMSAGCTALMDVVCLLPLAAALVLGFHEKKCPWMKWGASVLYGLALAMSGFALYALPVFLYLTVKGKMTARQMAVSAMVPLAACVPAILAGVPAGEALLSLLRANLALPQYAAGAPNALSMIPRALVEEMPAMFQLQRLNEIDVTTHAQPFYTQTHFEQAVRGMTICGIAVYGGVCAWLWQNKDMSALTKGFALLLTALLVCPGVTNGAWIAAGLVSLYAICADKKLRLPACLVLFSVCGAAAYPMLEETLLPMVTAFALCLCALLMALDIIPTTLNGKESVN